MAAAMTVGLSVACSGGAPSETPGDDGPTGPAPARDVRYMPLGDSITDGFGIPGGYRTALWQQLVETDHDRIDFVGSLSGGPSSLGDKDHQGLSGWCIDGVCRADGKDAVIPQIRGWMIRFQPDIVSIHLGTNDLATGASGATTAKRLDQLVDRIYLNRPDTYVVLVQTIPMGVRQTQHDEYDALVPGIADEYRAQGRRIAVADLSHVLELPRDYRDALHPTQAGYDTMGRALAPAVQAAYASVVQAQQTR